MGGRHRRNRDLARAFETFTERRAAERATEPEWFAEHETVEDDDGNIVWARFRGSPPDLDGMASPAIGTALLAGSCTRSCAPATAALKTRTAGQRRGRLLRVRCWSTPTERRHVDEPPRV